MVPNLEPMRTAFDETKQQGNKKPRKMKTDYKKYILKNEILKILKIHTKNETHIILHIFHLGCKTFVRRSNDEKIHDILLPFISLPLVPQSLHCKIPQMFVS